MHRYLNRPSKTAKVFPATFCKTKSALPVPTLQHCTEVSNDLLAIDETNGRSTDSRNATSLCHNIRAVGQGPARFINHATAESSWVEAADAGQTCGDSKHLNPCLPRAQQPSTCRKQRRWLSRTSRRWVRCRTRRPHPQGGHEQTSRLASNAQNSVSRARSIWHADTMRMGVLRRGVGHSQSLQGWPDCPGRENMPSAPRHQTILGGSQGTHSASSNTGKRRPKGYAQGTGSCECPAQKILVMPSLAHGVL